MNRLYYGDNLRVLRDSIKDGSVDLIYIDQPFNSNASFNLPFKGPTGTDSAAQIGAFDEVVRGRDAAGAVDLCGRRGLTAPTSDCHRHKFAMAAGGGAN